MSQFVDGGNRIVQSPGQPTDAVAGVTMVTTMEG